MNDIELDMVTYIMVCTFYFYIYIVVLYAMRFTIHHLNIRSILANICTNT